MENGLRDNKLVKRKFRVSIVQATIKQYRESFYLQLWERLAKYGIELTVIYSKPGRIDAGKKDDIDLPSALTKTVRRIYLLNDRILLQFLPISEVIRSDLIIIDQATGCVHNYPLLLLSRLGLKKIAFWGHGYNRQGNPATLSERFKKHLLNWSSSWFAYTSGTANYLISNGVSPDKITSVDNAIDTHGFQTLLDSVTYEELVEKRRQFGISDGDCVAIYCGSLYAGKRIPYLLKAAKLITKIEPRFRLLVVGSGAESDLVQKTSESDRNILYAGPLWGQNKAICFRLANIFLHPGAVGLGILDSFVASLPFVTTSEALHGPEIDYLDSGRNGLIVSGNEEAFVEAVVNLIRDPARFAMMQRSAKNTVNNYTIENMAEKMCNGILKSLGLKNEPNSAVSDNHSL